MQINTLGVPVVTSDLDQQKLDLFLDKLAANLYGRLPRFARLFLSQDALRALLGAAAANLVSRM
jgi:hypothetical protein